MSAGTDGLPPRAAVSQMATGYWVSQAVRAMAVLGLADHLASGPRTAEDLSEAAGAHTPSLARLLRALVALGLCGRETIGQFRLTPLGETMRSDVPESARPFVLFITAPWVERGWEELPHAVHTGEPTFPSVHGVGFWDYLGAPGGRGALRRRHERGRFRPRQGPPRREGPRKHRHGRRCRRRAGPAPGWALGGCPRPAYPIT